MSAIQKELNIRSSFLKDNTVDTIYLGGGTPSVLSRYELNLLVNEIQKSYLLSDNLETTLEANPDDLSFNYLQMLKEEGVNRLSIGVQSFNDEHLKWMNRSHTNAQTEACITAADLLGFTDITIDLIYGIPQLSPDEWRATVKKALGLPINHLSAYSLTLEENTPYKKLVNQQKYKKPDNDLAAEHYSILQEEIANHDWEQYEVSNYCKSRNYSKHNTAYWQNKPYLGVGPSAHSFDRLHRYWNVRNNKVYLEKLSENQLTAEKEKLTHTDRINELLLTGLRTKWGIDTAALKSQFGYDIRAKYESELLEWEGQKWLKIEGNTIKLTSEGLLFADYIASELFVV